MPQAIFLKEPKISVFAKDGEPKIEETMGVKMAVYAQHEDGKPMRIPVDNIAMIQSMADEEIKKMREESEERRKEMERRGGQRLTPTRIASPHFVIPGKKSGN